MDSKKNKSPIPDWKYASEIKRFQTEISDAEIILDRMSEMSDDELSSQAQKHYDHGVSFYKNRLEEIAEKGEDYEGEQGELEDERSSLKLLSPKEWKEKTITEAQSRASFYETEKSDVEEKYYPVVSPSMANVSHLRH